MTDLQLNGSADPTTGAPAARQSYANAAPVTAVQSPNATFATLAGYLKSLGLDTLFTTGPNGEPGGWLWEQLQSGVDTPDELVQAVEQTPVWQTRFSVIVEQRKRAAAGQPVQVLTPAQVVQYEDTAAQLFRNAGLPAWMYDDHSDFNTLMLGNVSPAELQQRLGQAWSTVHDMPAPVRQTFEQFYGVGQGDAALAAFFLNPERTQASIDRQASAAYAAGMGTTYGISIDQQRAERIADTGLSNQGINSNLAQISTMGNVFNEGIAEKVDLTAGTTGVDAVFGGNAGAATAIERRVRSRQANNAASAGGALVTNRGVTGLGTGTV